MLRYKRSPLCTLEIECPDITAKLPGYPNGFPCPGESCPMHQDYKPVDIKEYIKALASMKMNYIEK